MKKNKCLLNINTAKKTGEKGIDAIAGAWMSGSLEWKRWSSSASILSLMKSQVKTPHLKPEFCIAAVQIVLFRNLYGQDSLNWEQIIHFSMHKSILIFTFLD